MALVNLDGAHIAHSHFQPQDARRFAQGPQTRGVQHQAAPALALVAGVHRDVEQMRLLYAKHDHEVAQQRIATEQQSRVVAAVQYIAKVGARPGVGIGALLHFHHPRQAGQVHGRYARLGALHPFSSWVSAHRLRLAKQNW